MTGRDDLGYEVGSSSLGSASGQQEFEFSSGHAVLGECREGGKPAVTHLDQNSRNLFRDER